MPDENIRIVLLGPPGAGKGSLANLLKQSWHIEHISTGDLLREEIKKSSLIGKEAKSFIDKGELVADDVVTRLVSQRLRERDGKCGFMLDGFPRTVKQAQDLDGILENINQPLDFVFYLDATLPVIIKRLSGRRICRNCGALFHIYNRVPKKEGVCNECGGILYQRPDDNEETIKTRMDVYLKSTIPIVNYYENRGILKKFDGERETNETHAMVIKSFNESHKNRH